MKTESFNKWESSKSLTTGSVLILLLAIMAGCATTSGIERADRTTSSMETVESDIESTLDAVDAVETSLSELIRVGQRDISSAFESYSENVQRLEENASSYLQNAREMQSSAEDYFSAWENDSYENQRIQEVSERRRNEVRETYNRIPEVISEVETDLDTYISNNNEIQNYLSTDLTAQGIESMTPLIEETIYESENLRDRLLDVDESIENARDEMERRGRMDENDFDSNN
ncbi:MAG: DUF2959 family protein [Balneolaceae bacterium]